MREITRLHPSRVSLTLDAEPLSTATINLPKGEPTVSIGDWIELFQISGTAGIFRVASVTHDYITGAQTLKLEHGIVTLGDAFIAGKRNYTSWDPINPDVTVSGYAATVDVKYSFSGYWRLASLTIKNLDGSTVVAYLRSGTVVAKSLKTEQGIHVAVTQSLLDHAESVEGSWDGLAPMGVIASDQLIDCAAYGGAVGKR